MVRNFISRILFLYACLHTASSIDSDQDSRNKNHLQIEGAVSENLQLLKNKNDGNLRLKSYEQGQLAKETKKKSDGISFDDTGPDVAVDCSTDYKAADYATCVKCTGQRTSDVDLCGMSEARDFATFNIDENDIHRDDTPPNFDDNIDSFTAEVQHTFDQTREDIKDKCANGSAEEKRELCDTRMSVFKDIRSTPTGDEIIRGLIRKVNHSHSIARITKCQKTIIYAVWTAIGKGVFIWTTFILGSGSLAKTVAERFTASLKEIDENEVLSIFDRLYSLCGKERCSGVKFLGMLFQLLMELFSMADIISAAVNSVTNIWDLFIITFSFILTWTTNLFGGPFSWILLFCNIAASAIETLDVIETFYNIQEDCFPTKMPTQAPIPLPPGECVRWENDMSPEYTKDKTTMINSGDKNKADGYLNEVNVDRSTGCWAWAFNCYETRVLLKFSGVSTSIIPENIKDGWIVEHAILSLYTVSPIDKNDPRIQLLLVNGPPNSWNENTSWNTQPKNFLDGKQFQPLKRDHYNGIDVRSHVTAWLKSDLANNGWLLKTESTDGFTFKSSYRNTLRPKLMIRFSKSCENTSISLSL